MTPAARIAAAIELAEAIDSHAEKLPADHVASAFFHARRYIGGSDRRAISLRIWRMLRCRARVDWWLRANSMARDPRRRAIADLVFADRLTLPEVQDLFSGQTHAPGRLARDESDLVQELRAQTLTHKHMPLWVRCEFPDWLEPRLRKLFGDQVEEEMAALAEPAPVDLRVNTLKAEPERARELLAQGGIEAKPTALSPICLRLPARTPLANQEPFREGLVEVQDEGSQVASLLVGARAGEAVCDFCAGAGGKTLALAAAMGNKGRLLALDIDSRRSDRAAERLRRAGVHNVTRRVLDADNARWLKRQEKGFDRVLADVPCSGTGSWRRNPDAKWRLESKDLDELMARQQEILARASRLVRAGGRLVYVTCSLLREENEDQVNGFLEAHPEFAVMPMPEVWAETIGHDCPTHEPVLRLTPFSTKTDGFFVAVMERGG